MRRVAVAVAVVTACSSRRAPEVEVVGDPLGEWRAAPEEAYARSIWDLQAFGGRLYLGYGDAVVNTGPTDIIAFEPSSGRFIHEEVIQEEAILRYRVFGDRLFIPGADAVGVPDGMLYVRDATGWTLIPLPGVVHANDVAVRGDEICVALQDSTVGGAVRCTRDRGATWTSHSADTWRAVSLFEIGGELYVSSHDSGVRTLAGASVPFELPGVASDGNVLVSGPVRCGAEVVFIGRRVHYAARSATVEVLGLFRASRRATGALDVAKIDVPGRPSDVFASGDRCYALANRADGARFDVAIFESTDNRKWTQRVHFGAEAMARSAELMDGYFYVGLGCELGSPCSRAAGRLLRIAASP